DPTTTMTVQWIVSENVDALPPVEFALYGDDKPKWKSTDVEVRPYHYEGYRVARAELTGLKPGTEYQFRASSKAALRRFRTMPAKLTNSFQFVSGGDCGTGSSAVASNIIAARQDPMFALIGGDIAYDNGRSFSAHQRFFQNYSQHMVDTQGRMIPLVVCIGNH